MPSAPGTLTIAGLTVHFPLRGGVWSRNSTYVRAVEDVSLRVDGGRTYGLVGESGSGKTTVTRAILGLAPITQGEIRLDGELLPGTLARRSASMRALIQPVFQDVSNSVNPRRTVGSIVMDPMTVNHVGDRRSRWGRVLELLELVELPRAYAERYPHELSGGERQRVGIARALAIRPKVLVLDEPTSALDVSVQAKIVELLASIQQQLGLTYLLISHDLALVRNLAERIGVMYFGRLMEEGTSADIFEADRNPYTACLLTAVPDVEGDSGDRPRLRVLPGDLPSARVPLVGCAFQTRCPVRRDECASESPPFRQLTETHHSRCLFDDPLAAVSTVGPTGGAGAEHVGGLAQ